MATVMHSIRTAVYALRFAAAIKLHGILALFIAALLHDIGKSKVPGSILNKPGKLTADEMAVMKGHAGNGADVLEGKLPPIIVGMIRYHHENVDGTGYYGVQDIPVGARIIRICDVYDSLTSRRPYKEPWTREQALRYLLENTGTLFDTALTAAFVRSRLEGMEIARA